MKKVILQAGLYSILSFGVISCSNQPKDSKIQSDIQDKTKLNPQFATLTYTVSKGAVSISGQCPDENCKTSAEQAVKDVKGVKSVTNNITVSPSANVVIADDATLENSVEDVVDDYKDVEATVDNGEITLRGAISRDNLTKLMMELNALNPKKINNQLTIK